ncbi:metal-dependent hydrolase [Natrononativus amylolyticus]|uniref:metal-dependent hydrolase n=1 Tax=Natrononativus amylolyticus TaxID=2963434 RepID=UPI0020CD503D|nr:metal-dependent hydrolase [Natrononativus amylolyticus]
MWPWEHAIMGYLAYSLFSHVVYRESPDGLEAFAVVFASVLPDLIDKPLAWQFGVFETGYELGHSIFFAIPLSIAVGMYARSVGRPRAGLAFALGYLLHLPADVLDSYVRGGRVQFELVLWPVRTVELHPHEHQLSFGEQFSLLFAQYQQELLAGDPSLYIWSQIGIAVAAAVLWLYDGAPVLRECLEYLYGLLDEE